MAREFCFRALNLTLLSVVLLALGNCKDYSEGRQSLTWYIFSKNLQLCTLTAALLQSPQHHPHLVLLKFRLCLINFLKFFRILMLYLLNVLVTTVLISYLGQHQLMLEHIAFLQIRNMKLKNN